MRDAMKFLSALMNQTSDKKQRNIIASLMLKEDPSLIKPFVETSLENWRFIDRNDIMKLIELSHNWENNADNDLNIINMHFVMRDYAKVEELTRKYISDYPKDANGYLLHARNILAAGNNKEAILKCADDLMPVFDTIQDKKDFIGLQIAGMKLMYDIDDVDAWKYYDARLEAYKQYNNFWSFDREVTSLSGKKILVVMEQGFGDNFQSLITVPYLKKSGAQLVTILCRDKHVGNFVRRYPGVDLVMDIDQIEQNDLHRYPFTDYDLIVPGLSLPHRLMRYYKHYGNEPWMAKSAVLKISDLVALKCPIDIKPLDLGADVGFVWQGNPEFANDRIRSIGLDFMKPVIKSVKKQNYKCVSLQKGYISRDIPAVALGDWLRTASILKGLKLLISTDTGIVHMAGLLGVPVLMPVSVNGDWRWYNEGTTTPWYSSIEIFRQSTYGEWTENDVAKFSARAIQKLADIETSGDTN